jgi:tRNA dimethylallyltransferase
MTPVAATPRAPGDGAEHPDRQPPVVLLMGPTASGKTRVAMTLSRHLPVEIVSVDSAIVYRGMDIGTAKPDAAMRTAVAHHLIDIIDPTQAYSAARFSEDAWRLVAEIRGRGRMPLLVGGTMLYFKAFRDGLAQLPPADPEIRRRIDLLAQERGWPALHATLQGLDPETAARLEPTDAQRIQRALEVCELTGAPMSRLLSAAASTPPRSPILGISLEPSDRSVLHARIAERFDQMLAAGLVDELSALRVRHRLHHDLPAMRCVGYRQAWRYLEGAIDSDTLRLTGIAATRQLAKRQLTWLRKMNGLLRLDCLRPDLDEAVTAVIEAAVGQPGGLP